MNLDQLEQFIYESSARGYASDNKNERIMEEDGSTTIVYSRDDWRSHDNYFGGEPYGGRTVIFYKDKPVWIMVYYGAVVENINPTDIYGFLQKALRSTPPGHIFRGPKEFCHDALVYKNIWQGDTKSYSGEEIIEKEGEKVFYTKYSGGFVDTRKD
jgi:hypothetical protein